MRCQIREINPASAAELELVAGRMRETLVEVEGEAIGTALYSMDWLRDRVRWHLDAEKCTARVLLAEDEQRRITGHTIVRIEQDAGVRFGLFSTTFVIPECRRYGVADQLLIAGETWMAGQELAEAATWTSATNNALINLYGKHGYAIVAHHAHHVTHTNGQTCQDDTRHDQAALNERSDQAPSALARWAEATFAWDAASRSQVGLTQPCR